MAEKNHQEGEEPQHIQLRTIKAGARTTALVCRIEGDS
jgi:hypothetical protein